MAAHSHWGPSASERWLNCPGSVELITRINPPDESEFASREGTYCHLVMEQLILKNVVGVVDNTIERQEQIGEQLFATVEEEFDTVQMIKDLQDIIDYLQWINAEMPEAKIWVEQKVGIDNRVWGTADIVIWDAAYRYLEIIDFKYGRIPVPVENNTQTRLYLMGALLMDEIGRPEEMKVTIHQPRVKRGLQQKTVQMKELGDLHRRMKSALESDTFSTGGWCEYCPVKLHCDLFLKEVAAVADMTFIDLEEVAKLSWLLSRAGAIIKLLDEAAELAKDKLLAGETLEGFKLIHGKTNRRWSLKEEDLVQELRAMGLRPKDIYTQKLNGIPAIEKLLVKHKTLDKEDIAQYIEKPVGGPTLAKDTDPRKTYSKDET